MGSFVVYVLEWALCLSVFLFLYKMCFSGTTFHRFNRAFLLGSVVVSALLPLIHVTTNEQMEPIAEVCRINATQFEPMPVITQLQAQTPEINEQLTWGQKMFIFMAITYIIYIAIQVIGWLKSFVKLLLFLRGKRSRRVGRWIRLVVHDEEFGPFSWMNRIVISDKENGFGRRASIRHELSHITLGHPIDLVFLLLCTLVNPVCWLMMKEIKVVHEYEADNEVINRYHIRSRDYQRLLILRTVGAEAYALACSFNLNIKQRIIMMKKKQSQWWRMTWIVVTIPLVGLALTAFSKPKEALKEVVDSSVEIIEQPIVNALSAEPIEGVESEPAAPASVKEEQNVQEEVVKAGDLIKGTVKDAIGPLMGANIREVNNAGRIVSIAVSDMNGNFALKVKDPHNKIRVTYVGQKEQVFDISSHQLDVLMEEDSKIKNVEVVANHVSIDSNDPRYKDQGNNSDGGGYEMKEQMPSFPGGPMEIQKYLTTHMNYPAVAREMQAEAEIVVKFTIDKTGFVRSPKIAEVRVSSPIAKMTDANSPSRTVNTEFQKQMKEGDEAAAEKVKAFYDTVEAMKEEAIHVVRNMPRWEPARQNGKRVETTYTLPVSFKLQ